MTRPSPAAWRGPVSAVARTARASTARTARWIRFMVSIAAFPFSWAPILLLGGSVPPLMIGQAQPLPGEHRPAPLVAGHVHQGVPFAAIFLERFDPPLGVAVEERRVAGPVPARPEGLGPPEEPGIDRLASRRHRRRGSDTGARLPFQVGAELEDLARLGPQGPDRAAPVPFEHGGRAISAPGWHGEIRAQQLAGRGEAPDGAVGAGRSDPDRAAAGQDVAEPALPDSRRSRETDSLRPAPRPLAPEPRDGFRDQPH